MNHQLQWSHIIVTHTLLSTLSFHLLRVIVNIYVQITEIKMAGWTYQYLSLFLEET